jgi:N-acetylmuramoyl-L-alanine amidase
MGDKVLKYTAVFTFGLMLSVVIFSLILSYRAGLVGDDSALAAIKTVYEKQNESKDYLSTVDELKDELGDKYIAINNAGNNEFTVSEDYINKGLTLIIKGLKDKSLTEDSIVRVNNKESYQGIVSQKAEAEKSGYLVPEVLNAEDGEISYGIIPEFEDTDPVTKIDIDYNKKEDGTYEAIIQLTLDHVYAPFMLEEKGQVYIALKKPSEVYEHIVVLDAGHGGKDPGAEAFDGSYYEKEINLKILLYVKELLDKENIKVYYTRTDDRTIYLNPRVNLANETEADLFISIHCNSSESSLPRGLEVLYKSNWNKSSYSSEQLARIALEEMKTVTGHVNRGLVAGDEMLIINKSQVPVALIEVGFMSNPQELEFLKSSKREKEIGKAITQIIKRALVEKDISN